MNNQTENTALAIVDSNTDIDTIELNPTNDYYRFQKIYEDNDLNDAEIVFATEKAINILLETEGLRDLVLSNYKTNRDYPVQYINKLLNRKHVKKAMAEIRQIYYADKASEKRYVIRDKIDNRVIGMIDNIDTEDKVILKIYDIILENEKQKKTETIITTETAKVKDFSMWQKDDSTTNTIPGATATATKEITKITKERV